MNDKVSGLSLKQVEQVIQEVIDETLLGHRKSVGDALIFFISCLFGALWLVLWVVGVVLAKGFWSTLIAVTTGGLWSSYLVAEMLLRRFWLI